MPVDATSYTKPPQPRLAVSERSYASEPGLDTHPFLQVVLPERGRLEMQIGGERGRVEGVRFALIPSGVEHHYWSHGPNRFLILDLAPSLVSEARQRLARPGAIPDEPFPLIGERLAALASLLRAEMARGGLGEPLVAESLGLYAGTLLYNPPGVSASGDRSSPGMRRLARKTRDYLEGTYLEPLTISQIADAVGASASHMQRAFRAHHGVTIVGYLQARRLERAKALLRETDLAIIEVAFASGFNDPGYFTRLFSRDVGLSPIRYRVAIRAGSDNDSR